MCWIMHLFDWHLGMLRTLVNFARGRRTYIQFAVWIFFLDSTFSLIYLEDLKSAASSNAILQCFKKIIISVCSKKKNKTKRKRRKHFDLFSCFWLASPGRILWHTMYIWLCKMYFNSGHCCPCFRYRQCYQPGSKQTILFPYERFCHYGKRCGCNVKLHQEGRCNISCLM